jgi:hypothetical protein
MVNEETIDYLRYLYENIFDESVGNSKEFLNFVHGNVHPLRIKVEDWLADRSGLDILYQFNINTEQNALMNKMQSAKELDTFITNYIENNNV